MLGHYSGSLEHYSKIIESVGEDITRPGLMGTPNRASKAFEFLTEGYDKDLTVLVNGAIFPSESTGMVLVRDIEMYSLCEHHLLPFFGKCHIAYIPDKKILGLSKFARVVDMFARRLQVQENLTQQVADAIQQVVQAKGVCVRIDARHMCMMMRGVEKQESTTTTLCCLGVFQENRNLVNDFLMLI